MPAKIRDGESGSKKPTAKPPHQSRWWYETPKDSAPEAALATYVQELKQRNSSRLQNDLENLRLYGAPASTGPYMSGKYGRGQQSSFLLTNNGRVTISLAQACIDTLKSKLSTDEPRPMFITSGGDYTAQQLAQQLQGFNDGAFYETRAYELALACFVDAAIFGTGFALPYIDSAGRLAIERVFPYELFVDDADGLYGEPRNIYRVKYVDRGKMAALYPDFKSEIVLAAGLQAEDGGLTTQRNNLVQVVEAWHLPSGPDAKDGRHMIAVSNAALIDEGYDDEEFPFVKLVYNPKQLGYFGQGLCEIISPLQQELNSLLRKIQLCMHFLAIPHWLKPSGANIRFGAFNNQIGSVIDYSNGMKPDLMVPNSVPTELFQHVDWLYAKAFELAGVSQMEAQSKVPGYGTMSGAAVREVRDVASDRFKSLEKAWGRFHLDLAAKNVKLVAGAQGGYKVTVVRKSITGKPERLETIDFKKIELKERKYQIMLQPVSKFATDIPGAMQTGQELVQAGLMDPDTFKDLMNFPDLKAEQDLDAASRKLTHKRVAAILDDNDYIAPDPYMDLQYAVKYATLRMNLAMADDMPAEHIESLRTWISACDDLMQSAQAPQAGPPSTAPGAPPPGGAVPPQPLAAAAQPQQVMA